MTAEDIIYTPLDLPPCPTVNLSKLYSWIDDTYPQTDLLKFTHSKILAKHSHKAEYSWNTTFAKALTWRNNFQEEFPEIVEYVTKGWGFSDNEMLGVILLPKRVDLLAKGFWHSDADKLGLRFYIEFENLKNDKLLFKKTLTHSISDENLFRFFEEDTELEKITYEAKILNNRQPFYINNYAAAHTVYNVSDQRRVAVILGTSHEKNYNVSIKQKVNKLVVDSAMKFHKEAIFWHDWSDGISR
tara:strand:+ start:484 stop:1212 length:729 start_codon:yes stop_codon:yes gene_type:complete